MAGTSEIRDVLVRILEDINPDFIQVLVEEPRDQIVLYIHSVPPAWITKLTKLFYKPEPRMKPEFGRWQKVYLPPWKMSKTELDEFTNEINKALLINSSSKSRCNLHEQIKEYDKRANRHRN